MLAHQLLISRRFPYCIQLSLHEGCLSISDLSWASDSQGHLSITFSPACSIKHLHSFHLKTSQPLSSVYQVCMCSHFIQTSQEPRCHSKYLTFLNLFYTRSDPIVSFALSVFPEPLHLSVSPSPSDFLVITSVSVASSCDQSCFSLYSYCQSDRLKAQIC